jgi:hypothetical protein
MPSVIISVKLRPNQHLDFIVQSHFTVSTSFSGSALHNIFINMVHAEHRPDCLHKQFCCIGWTQFCCISLVGLNTFGMFCTDKRNTLQRYTCTYVWTNWMKNTIVAHCHTYYRFLITKKTHPIIIN